MKKPFEAEPARRGRAAPRSGRRAGGGRAALVARVPVAGSEAIALVREQMQQLGLDPGAPRRARDPRPGRRRARVVPRLADDPGRRPRHPGPGRPAARANLPRLPAARRARSRRSPTRPTSPRRSRLRSKRRVRMSEAERPSSAPRRRRSSCQTRPGGRARLPAGRRGAGDGGRLDLQPLPLRARLARSASSTSPATTPSAASASSPSTPTTPSAIRPTGRRRCASGSSARAGRFRTSTTQTRRRPAAWDAPHDAAPVRPRRRAAARYEGAPDADHQDPSLQARVAARRARRGARRATSRPRAPSRSAARSSGGRERRTG